MSDRFLSVGFRVAAICFFLSGLPQAEARSQESGSFEFRVAALNDWSPGLLRLDLSEQGKFYVSSDGNSIRIHYVPGREGFDGGSPALLIGQRITVDRDNLTVPVVDSQESLAGWTSGELSSESAGGLFYALISPEVWDSLAKTGDVSQADGKRRKLIYFIRALENNRPHLIRALQQQDGKDVVVVLMWLPGVARFGAMKETQVELCNLKFSPMSVSSSSAQQLLQKVDPTKIKGLDLTQPLENPIDAVLKYFSGKFSSKKTKASDAISANPEAADLLEDRWHLVLGDKTEIVSQSPPFNWEKTDFSSDPEWIYHLHWYRNFAPLTKAFEETFNPVYLQKWLEITRDWVTQNPPGTMVSWRSLDTAIRTPALLRQISAVYNQQVLSDADRIDLLNLIADHADFLVDPIMYHPVNNWGTAETSALLQLAEQFPEFSSADEWRSVGNSRLNRACRRLVHSDGSTDEMTISYHIHVLDSLVKSGLGTNGKWKTEVVRDTVEKMFSYLMCFAKPDGSMPLLGHSYRCSCEEALSKGVSLFKNPYWQYVASRGEKGECPPYRDTMIDQSPHFVMRTDWVDPDALYLLIKGTTRGRPGMDGFNLIFYAYGRTLLPDAGAYSYSPPWKEEFSKTRQHSTVTVGSADQQPGADVTLHQWKQTDTFSYFDGTLQPYDGVSHRRRVIMMRSEPQYVLVLDDLTGTADGPVSSRFWFTPDVDDTVLVETNQSAYTVTANKSDIMVMETLNKKAHVYLDDGWYSETYGKKTQRKGFVVEAPALPCRFGTLLYPIRRGKVLPSLKAVWNSEQNELVIQHMSGQDSIRFGDNTELPEITR